MFSADSPARARQGLEQPLQTGLDPDQLGRRTAAQAGQFLLDVADQLPGVARELLPHRVGRIHQEGQGRDQAAVHAGVQHQGQGPAVGGDIGVGVPTSRQSTVADGW